MLNAATNCHCDRDASTVASSFPTARAAFMEDAGPLTPHWPTSKQPSTCHRCAHITTSMTQQTSLHMATTLIPTDASTACHDDKPNHLPQATRDARCATPTHAVTSTAKCSSNNTQTLPKSHTSIWPKLYALESAKIMASPTN